MQVVAVVLTVTLTGKLDSSSEVTFLSIILVALGFGAADALCHAAAFSCKYFSQSTLILAEELFLSTQFHVDASQ